ncbi:MAG: transcription termination factor Rho [Blautia wexlerae]|nr:transcription termination factor Rho [Blautia wexlerae]
MMRLIRGNVEREVTDTAVAEKLIKDGFKQIEEGTVEAVPSENKEKNLEEMTAEELKALAKEKGLSGVSSLAKKELIEILKG